MTRCRDHAARLASMLLACLVAACASSGPEPSTRRGDLVVVQASTAARFALDKGDYEQARDLYRRALMRARAIDDALAAADAAYNQAVSEIGLGRYQAADRLLREARYDATRAAADIADIDLLRAKVAYLQRQSAQALALAHTVAIAGAAPALRVQALILRGQVFADREALQSATFELQMARALATTLGDAYTAGMRADFAKLEGSIATLEGRTEAAARIFDTEVALLRSARRYRDLGHALARAGEAYRAADRPAAAADRFFLAARVFDSAGDGNAAKTLLAASLAEARRAADEETRGRASALLEDINRRAGP